MLKRQADPNTKLSRCHEKLESSLNKGVYFSLNCNRVINGLKSISGLLSVTNNSQTDANSICTCGMPSSMNSSDVRTNPNRP